jgi:hypothetical protein
MRGNQTHTFIFDCPIICKTVILSNRTTALDVYTVLIPKDLVGSSVIGQLKI